MTNDPRLVVTSPAELAGTVLPLSRRQQVIGHSDTADLVLDDRYVSSRHALVTVDDSAQVTITDLNSTGGTFVGGARLAGPRVLRDGDLVQLAGLVARFECDSPPQPQAEAQTQVLGPVVPVPGSAGPTPGPAGPPPPAVPPPIVAPQPPGVLPPPVVPPPVVAPPPGPTPPGPVGTPTIYTVAGTVATPALPGAAGLTVNLVDKNVGGDQLLATTQTGGDGGYAFPQVPITDEYLAQHYKTAPDLQVQVYSPAGVFLAASAVSYAAPVTVTLNVVLPAGAAGLPSEYETLAANLAAAYPGSLASLQEGNGRSDLTYLANRTGWDARAVALAALAGQLSQLTAVVAPPSADAGQTQAGMAAATTIAPEFYYALLRAGLPADPDSLFQTSPATAGAVWQQAMAANVIPPALAKGLPAAVASFTAISATRSLTAPPPAGVSTLGEMLAPALPEQAQQQQFASLYAQYQGDWDHFWPAVEQALGSTAASQLRLTGQLYYLTVNNQPLVAALTAAQDGNPLTSAQDLVARGYYDPAAWLPLIGTSVPAGVPGADAQEQAASYAQLLAAQVRVAYPTAVLADQVSRGVMPVAGPADVAGGVASFLTASGGQFEIGVEPVEGFLARTGFAAPAPEVITQVKRLQRVYQLTPDDTSMSVLLRHNLDSAFAVTRYDTAGFVRAFGTELGGPDAATAIHLRARQVFASVLGVALSYLGGRVTPALGAGQTPLQYGFPPPPSGTAGAAYPVSAYPTLEDLFGSLDYCNCSDCGSILSPAAYLVDLLNYTDQPAPAAAFANPQDVLLQRRPDLQYLPLTCANTNTALPYIDIVNETLEYFVTNGLSLAGYQGHDTGDAVTSAELVASPQYVNDAAYAILAGGFFPPPLPFSRPLTLLRLHLARLGVALPAAMTALRQGDELVNPATPASYGWRDILIEQLTISRDEYRLFTDPALGLGDLYGLPDATALATLQTTSLQDLSRRLGVSYDDLTSIVATQFMNPNASLIPRLEKLNAPFATLKALHDNLGTASSIAAAFISALPAGLDATEYGGVSPADYQAVVTWVTSPQVYPLIMDIITISEPAAGVSDCSGAALQLRYSNPDMTANFLSGTDLVKLIRFIRLWQKLAPLLGDASDAVTIAQTDAIITALYPAADQPAGTSDTTNDPANRVRLDAGFQTLLLRAGFLFQVMSLLSLTADTALGPLLACWAPIGTPVPDSQAWPSLYQAMFLTPTLLQQDPGAQTATVSSTVNAGDTLTTTINGVSIDYTVTAGDTAATAAAAIAAAVNATTTADPASGQPLGRRFLASAQGGVVTVMAGCTLDCSVSSGASETYTADAGTPVSLPATVAGPVTAGDVLTTTLDGVPIPYTTVAGDTPATIAAGIAAAVNATTTADPSSGMPLNSLVVASSAGPVVTVTVANAGAPFSLACSDAPASAGTYQAAPPVPAAVTATITGPFSPGDTLTTTVNSVAVSYTAAPTDTDANTLAASVAAVINASVLPDPATQLPLSSEVQATSTANVITVTAVDPASPVTLACSGLAGYTAAGPFPQQATATVAGTIPAGALLTTTVNTLPLVYQTLPGDTPATIATAIAALIDGTSTGDPVSGLPLDSIVTASAAAGVITVTGASVTTPFTLAAELTAGGYTAGRATPPFADDGYGGFLTDPDQTLLGHQPTLCAACNLTGAEFALITETLGFDPSTPLTLPNVSALLRYGWLAHTLGLSVLEFCLLRSRTGLDPFAPLDPAATAPVPPPVISFIALLDAASAAGLTTVAALYLMWNCDISGTSAPTTSDVTGLASALVAGFAAVDAEFSLRDDPDGSIAEGLMTLVYGAAASGFFFGLLNNTLTTSASYSTPAGQSALPAGVIAASAGRLSYDNLRKQLTFAGLLDAATLTAIDAAATDPALTAALGHLAAASQQAVTPFFTTYPELRPLYAAYVAATAVPAATRRTGLLASFLPILQAKRKQEQALAAITSAAGTDPSFATALLTSPAILHADADPAQPAVNDLTAIGNQGLTAQFFLGNDTSSPPDTVVDPVPLLSYARTATVGGTTTGGDTLTTTINGVTVSYAAGAADTSPALLAASVAAAINAATAPDPATTLPLNQVVTASATANVITITGLDPTGATSYFTLTCATSAGATETYTAGSQLPPGHGGGAIAGIWSGYIAAPQDGDYDINVAVDPGATVALQVGGVIVPGSQAGSLWSNAGPITLVAGALTPVRLTVTSLTSTLAVSWQSLGLGWQPIPASQLYSFSLTGRLGDTYTRFLKATSLASALSLTAGEIAYLGQGWLNSLTGGFLTGPFGEPAADPDPATAARLAVELTQLLDFTRMKQALSPAGERLLAVLQDPAATLPGGQSALLSLTGWDQSSVTALLTQFFGGTSPASLSTVANLTRLYDAYAVVKACGLAAPVVIGAITNAPSATTVSALQSALRAKYAESDWLTVAGPINDSARIAQRDALVAYVLQRLGDAYAQSLVTQVTSADAATGATTLTCAAVTGIVTGMLIQGPGLAAGTTVTAVAGDTVTLSTSLLAALPAGSVLTFVPPGAVQIATTDDLYASLLIDTQTQPAVLTSRILLALATVQLFVERVIRNLEPRVAATDVDAAQWEWMKRYRVWQANREVFLWPENWLYPELRDNPSPFFQQMMSSLLQGDITDDAAAAAYLTYLTSLEEVAKLEPCGMYYQPGTAGTDETTYVVSRTAGAHRKYYFRELSSGSWTPWAQVQIDCEDMPVTPIIWNGRLFLFWLKTVKQSQPQQPDTSSMPGGPVNSYTVSQMQGYAQAAGQSQGQGAVAVNAVLCWTEYYNGTWQPTKTSDVNRPTTIGAFDVSGPGAFENYRSQVRIVPASYTGTSRWVELLGIQLTMPPDALLLAITVASDYYNVGGFLLHNTHSLPVPFEDMQLSGTWEGSPVSVDLSTVLDPPAPFRSITPPASAVGGYGSGTFTVSYQTALGGSATYTTNVLDYTWMPRFVDSQPGQPGAWDAPLIYEDRRNQFYVTTTENLVPVWAYNGFGILHAAPATLAPAQAIPSLVLRTPVSAGVPNEIAAVTAGGDPASVQRFLSLGTNLNAALPAQFEVSYQGQVISPIGSAAALNPGNGGVAAQDAG